MKKNSIFVAFLIINALIFFFALNPWITKWKDRSIAVLIFEAVFIFIISIPVVLYQMIQKKRASDEVFQIL